MALARGYHSGSQARSSQTKSAGCRRAGITPRPEDGNQEIDENRFIGTRRVRLHEIGGTHLTSSQPRRYQRITFPPHVKPAPKASVITSAPSLQAICALAFHKRIRNHLNAIPHLGGPLVFALRSRVKHLFFESLD